jgi:hypothetical protein
MLLHLWRPLITVIDLLVRDLVPRRFVVVSLDHFFDFIRFELKQLLRDSITEPDLRLGNGFPLFKSWMIPPRRRPSSVDLGIDFLFVKLLVSLVIVEHPLLFFGQVKDFAVVCRIHPTITVEKCFFDTLTSIHTSGELLHSLNRYDSLPFSTS